jgi:phosphate transport system protein
LALRHPIALDLRVVTTAMKIASDLERMGDYATNVAKRSITLNKLDPVRPIVAVPRIAELVQGMVKDVLDAFVERDVEKALSVWRRDEDVDAMYNSLFRELLTYMMEDPRHITPCIHTLFIAKNLERIGDHATNIAEQINFLVKGKPVEEDRPKGDVTPFSTSPN